MVGTNSAWCQRHVLRHLEAIHWSCSNGRFLGVKGLWHHWFSIGKNPTYTGRTNVLPRTPNLGVARIKGVKNVFMVLMENHDWNTIKGSTFCPYINNTLKPYLGDAAYANDLSDLFKTNR